ncbi:unnamed protein product [Chrysoparadoxa australica]
MGLKMEQAKEETEGDEFRSWNCVCKQSIPECGRCPTPLASPPKSPHSGDIEQAHSSALSSLSVAEQEMAQGRPRRRSRSAGGTTSSVWEEEAADVRVRGPHSCSSVQELAQRVGVAAETGMAYIADEPKVCDACRFCEDTCPIRSCSGCSQKQQQASRRPPTGGRGYFTPCEVRRHCLMGSAWIVCSGKVYDVTCYLELHPGGKRSILRNAGGTDCEEDMRFHSKGAQKMLGNFLIGTLWECPGGDKGKAGTKELCSGGALSLGEQEGERRRRVGKHGVRDDSCTIS